MRSSFCNNLKAPWIKIIFFHVSGTYVQAQTTCSSNLLVQNVNNESGLIQSSMGSSYFSNMNCNWTITSDAILELVFVGPFNIGYNDFVYVYNGSSSSSQLIGQFSGSFRPGPIVSSSNQSSNQLHVRFSSNYYGQYYGFKAIYRGMYFPQLELFFSLQLTAHSLHCRTAMWEFLFALLILAM